MEKYRKIIPTFDENPITIFLGIYGPQIFTECVKLNKNKNQKRAGFRPDLIFSSRHVRRGGGKINKVKFKKKIVYLIQN